MRPDDTGGRLNKARWLPSRLVFARNRMPMWHRYGMKMTLPPRFAANASASENFSNR
jgi:hypothetical protein